MTQLVNKSKNSFKVIGLCIRVVGLLNNKSVSAVSYVSGL